MLVSLIKAGQSVSRLSLRCLGEMTARMREVLDRPWVGVIVPFTLRWS